jgi:hypothetical protein
MPCPARSGKRVGDRRVTFATSAVYTAPDAPPWSTHIRRPVHERWERDDVPYRRRTGRPARFGRVLGPYRNADRTYSHRSRPQPGYARHLGVATPRWRAELARRVEPRKCRSCAYGLPPQLQDRIRDPPGAAPPLRITRSDSERPAPVFVLELEPPRLPERNRTVVLAVDHRVRTPEPERRRTFPGFFGRLEQHACNAYVPSRRRTNDAVRPPGNASYLQRSPPPGGAGSAFTVLERDRSAASSSPAGPMRAPPFGSGAFAADEQWAWFGPKVIDREGEIPLERGDRFGADKRAERRHQLRVVSEQIAVRGGVLASHRREVRVDNLDLGHVTQLGRRARCRRVPIGSYGAARPPRLNQATNSSRSGRRASPGEDTQATTREPSDVQHLGSAAELAEIYRVRAEHVRRLSFDARGLDEAASWILTSTPTHSWSAHSVASRWPQAVRTPIRRWRSMVVIKASCPISRPRASADRQLWRFVRPGATHRPKCRFERSECASSLRRRSETRFPIRPRDGDSYSRSAARDRTQAVVSFHRARRRRRGADRCQSCATRSSARRRVGEVRARDQVRAPTARRRGSFHGSRATRRRRRSAKAQRMSRAVAWCAESRTMTSSRTTLPDGDGRNMRARDPQG